MDISRSKVIDQSIYFYIFVLTIVPFCTLTEFRITYKMILSLLRKKDMRIQDFMRRSFSEHNTTSQAESPAVYEAANVYLNEKLVAFEQKCRQQAGVHNCTFCTENKMLNFYQTCAQYAAVSQELYDKLLVHGAIFKSLTPGRIVFVKSITKDGGSTVFKLAPVVLVEAFSKGL